MAIEITTERETTLAESNEDRDPLEMKDLGMTTFNYHLRYQKIFHEFNCLYQRHTE